MGFFSTLGEIIIKVFYWIGTIVIELIKLPGRIRSGDVKERIRGMEMGEMFRKAREMSSEIVSQHAHGIGRIRGGEDKVQVDDAHIMIRGARFEPSEKENTILKLQLSATAFIITSILYSFNLIPLIIFGSVGVLLIFMVGYILYYQVRIMYPDDFNAYRDFFIMYIMVGFFIVVVANNPAFSTSFFFTFFPSLSILLFAVIAVLVVFLVFRIRYYRDYTFGEVIEAGKNASYVRVDYDIRSNVKPDIYVVENNEFKVKENDRVKLAIEGSLFSARGNHPTKIIGIIR